MPHRSANDIQAKKIIKMENYAINIRREIHERPEVGFDLENTLSIVRRELDKMGVEYTEKYGKSSIVATIGEREGYTLAIRADMDALPIEEKNDVPYKSKNVGKMHACGHDAHTAILLDVVRRVNEIKDEIPYRVKFFFQSAEEYAPGGASLMVRDGVMEGVDEVYALHVAPNVDTGVITLRPGPQNAASNGFYLNFYGVSAHAARKEEGRDAIKMALTAYFDIEKIVDEHKSAGEKIVFHVGKVEGGKTNNIVASECSLFCTLRTLDDETADKLKAEIEAAAKLAAEKLGGRAELVMSKSYPVVINDEGATQSIKKAALNVIGEENITVGNRGMGGEDFSYFTRLAPGCMFHLGVRNEALFEPKPLHNDKFQLDERALGIGSDIFVQLVLNKANEINGK